MSNKEQHGNKETKKSPTKTLKEKRDAKHAKKHAKDQPLLPPQTHQH